MKIWVKILRLYYDIFAKIAPTLRKFEKKRKKIRGMSMDDRDAVPRPYEAHLLVLLSFFFFLVFLSIGALLAKMARDNLHIFT